MKKSFIRNLLKLSTLVLLTTQICFGGGGTTLWRTTSKVTNPDQVPITFKREHCSSDFNITGSAKVSDTFYSNGQKCGKFQNNIDVVKVNTYKSLNVCKSFINQYPIPPQVCVISPLNRNSEVPPHCAYAKADENGNLDTFAITASCWGGLLINGEAYSTNIYEVGSLEEQSFCGRQATVDYETDTTPCTLEAYCDDIGFAKSDVLCKDVK